MADEYEDLVPSDPEDDDAEQKESGRQLSGFASSEYWTPERRQRQSEWAKQAIREGRFGGKPGQGGRPRKKTVTQVLAEKAAERAERIDRKLNQMLDHPSPGIRIAAIDRYMQADQAAEKNRRDDERRILEMGDDEVQKALLEVIAELDGQDIVDAEEVEEIDPAPELESG